MSMSGYSPPSVAHARADFQQQGVAIAAVLQMMAVFVARLEAGAVAGFQNLFAGIGDQHHFAGKT